MKARLLCSLAGVAITLLGATSAASAAGGSPAWSLTDVAYPTRFPAGKVGNESQQGPAYLVTAVNTGSESITGQFTIVDELPKNVTVSPGREPSGLFGQEGLSVPPEMSCSVAERSEGSGSSKVVEQTVTCTAGHPVLEPDEPVKSILAPGERVQVLIPVKVPSSAKGTLVNTATVSEGGAIPARATTETPVTSTPSTFDFVPGAAGLSAFFTDAGGNPVIQAGSHPYRAEVNLNFTLNPNAPGQSAPLPAGGGLRDASATLPQGMAVDPQAAPQCEEPQLEAGLCPPETQIGTVRLTLGIIGLGVSNRALFNMVPPPGTAAEFGFEVLEGTYIHLAGKVIGGDGRYRLSAGAADTLAKVGVAGFSATLWGNPTDASHHAMRGSCINASAEIPIPCDVEFRDAPFVTMPTSCSGPLNTEAHADGWAEPQNPVTRTYETTDQNEEPLGVEGCNALEFEPTFESRATTNQGESPSGLEFELHQRQNPGLEELATAPLKEVTVTLPEGMVLNPSAANGREACSAAQLGITSAAGAFPFTYKEEPAHCPSSSRLGSVEVVTPLLDHPLPGSVYLAKPFDNPFGSLLGIYLVVDDEQTGTIAKLAGRVSPDPVTGQLTTRFEESPELPLEDIKLEIEPGARAALTTPVTCGKKTITSTMTPWSTPEGLDANLSSSFETTASCFGSAAAVPAKLSFSAGTASPLSGAFSPFSLHIARKDGTQHITGVETLLPEGLVGKLAGVAYCPESGIALARSREAPELGKDELASPSCPASSQVGTVTVTAGSGIAPIPVSGDVYLAGPYKGAPLSLVVIVPSVAGPFDLGDVVDRVALYVDESTTRIHAVADPLPTILDGIPLDVRSIELRLDRPEFTLNPTSCEASSIDGSVSTAGGQAVGVTNYFQVGECGRLPFKPKISLSLKGGTRRGKDPALKAVLTQPAGQANIGSVAATLPKSMLIDNRHINSPCTRVQFSAGGGKGEQCPSSSILGYARAWSPLLDEPLQGPVYFLANGGERELPDLVASLGGQVHLNVVGFIDAVHRKGSEVSRVRNTFATVPDAPVSKFVLEMKGGKKGLLQNGANLCKVNNTAAVLIGAQNGTTTELRPEIANDCKVKKKSKKGKKSEKGKSGAARELHR